MTHSAAETNAETDIRFWATTHYKPGQKLDPTNPLDRAMVPAWVDANRRVLAEDRAGTLSITYNDPLVVRALARAEAAHDDAAILVDAADGHAAGATQATLPGVLQAVRDLGAQASAAVQAGNRALGDVAALHPPSINPVVAAQSASDAAKVAVTNAADQVAKSVAVKAGEKAAGKLAQHAAPKSGGGGGGLAVGLGVAAIGLLLVVRK